MTNGSEATRLFHVGNYLLSENGKWGNGQSIDIRKRWISLVTMQFCTFWAYLKAFSELSVLREWKILREKERISTNRKNVNRKENFVILVFHSQVQMLVLLRRLVRFTSRCHLDVDFSRAELEVKIKREEKRKF